MCGFSTVGVSWGGGVVGIAYHHHTPSFAKHTHLLGHVIDLADTVQVLWGVLGHAQGELSELLLQACSEDGGLCLEDLGACHARKGGLGCTVRGRRRGGGNQTPPNGPPYAGPPLPRGATRSTTTHPCP